MGFLDEFIAEANAPASLFPVVIWTYTSAPATFTDPTDPAGCTFLIVVPPNITPPAVIANAIGGANVIKATRKLASGYTVYVG